MIRGLLLILDAGGSWNKIATAQRGFLFILAVHLLPLLTITLGLEAFALVRLGEGRAISGDPTRVGTEAALRYAVAEAVLNLGLILVGARIVQQLARSFHDRVTYLTCFTILAYTLSPLFLLHLLDALPGVNTWACYGAGILLSVAVLYLAIPIVMRPDPAKAMGIYVTMAVLLVVMTGLAHFLAVQILHNQLNLQFWRDFL
jgi:hypothetical protein